MPHGKAVSTALAAAFALLLVAPAAAWAPPVPDCDVCKSRLLVPKDPKAVSGPCLRAGFRPSCEGLRPTVDQLGEASEDRLKPYAPTRSRRFR
jgi:hypothetical protein